MIHLKKHLNIETQIELIETCRKIAIQAPLMTFKINNYPMKVEMTSCGKYAWLIENNQYKYSQIHPITKQPFPPIPQIILDIIKPITEMIEEPNYQPETCLINFYRNNSKLGFHQDNSETNLKPAIISISLGNSAIFQIKENSEIKEILLESGDILILNKKSRLAYHAISRIIPNTNNLLRSESRLNLTIRQIF